MLSIARLSFLAGRPQAKQSEAWGTAVATTGGTPKDALPHESFCQELEHLTN